jgi:phospholipid/cholesterol/gamma-HCH transport system substrate-binding protein
MPSARRVRWAKFRVISVSAAAIAILMTLVYLLTGGTLLEKKATLYLYIPDATGLSHDSPVRVDGIDAGTVSTVGLSGSNSPRRIVRVTMALAREKLDSISTDSMAQISTDTLVGDKFVDITSGTDPGHIQPGGELNFKSQPDMMRTIDLVDFERQLRVVDATLSDIEKGANPLGQFILTGTVYESLRKKFIEMQRLIRTATETTTFAGSVIYTDALYLKMQQPFVQLDQALARLQSGQGEFGKFLRDPAQYEQARAQIQDLRKSIANVQSASFISSDETYAGWNRTVAALIQKVDEVNAMSMFSSSEVYDNLNGMAAEAQKTMKDFRQDPKKFLHVKIF